MFYLLRMNLALLSSVYSRPLWGEIPPQKKKNFRNPPQKKFDETKPKSLSASQWLPKQKPACKSENPLLSFISCCYNLVPFEAHMIVVDMCNNKLHIIYSSLIPIKIVLWNRQESLNTAEPKSKNWQEPTIFQSLSTDYNDSNSTANCCSLLHCGTVA